MTIKRYNNLQTMHLDGDFFSVNDVREAINKIAQKSFSMNLNKASAKLEMFHEISKELGISICTSIQTKEIK